MSGGGHEIAALGTMMRTSERLVRPGALLALDDESRAWAICRAAGIPRTIEAADALERVLAERGERLGSVFRALFVDGHSVTSAARSLGVSRQTVWRARRRIEELAISDPDVIVAVSRWRGGLSIGEGAPWRTVEGGVR